MNLSKGLIAAALAATGCWSAAAQAAPMQYDCDAPSGRLSSLSQAIGGSVRLAGTIAPVSFQPGKALPVGAMFVSSGDGRNAVGFQLVLPAVDAKALNLVLIARNNGKLERRALRTVPFGGSVPFSLALAANGQGQFKLADATINLAFGNLQSGNAMVSCTSGNFRFDNLDIVTG